MPSRRAQRRARESAPLPSTIGRGGKVRYIVRAGGFFRVFDANNHGDLLHGFGHYPPPTWEGVGYVAALDMPPQSRIRGGWTRAAQYGAAWHSIEEGYEFLWEERNHATGPAVVWTIVEGVRVANGTLQLPDAIVSDAALAALGGPVFRK